MEGALPKNRGYYWADFFLMSSIYVVMAFIFQNVKIQQLLRGKEKIGGTQNHLSQFNFYSVFVRMHFSISVQYMVKYGHYVLEVLAETG